jgi:hypothetical protein
VSATDDSRLLRDCPRTFDSKSMTTEDAAAAAASAAL